MNIPGHVGTKEEAEIVRLLRAYHAAMVDARVTDLDEMLARAFALVHITGVRQPKREWCDVVRAGRFDYHSIDVEESSLVAMVDGDVATVKGRGVFVATIDRVKRPWRLQFTVQCERADGHWLITEACYASD